MSAMKQSAINQPATPADATEIKAYGDRHFKPVVTPGLLKSPIFPAWLSKHFRRTDTPVSR
jgi:hypothetical protein